MQPSTAQLDYFAPSHPPFFPSIPTTLGFLKNFAHTHTWGRFFGRHRPMLENQQKFRKMWKNVHSPQRTRLARVVSSSSLGDFLFSTSKHPTHLASTPHRVGWDPLDFAKMDKNRKNMKKCASYSARAGESNAIFSSRIGPLLTKPLTL